MFSSTVVSWMEWCRQQNMGLISLFFFSDLLSLNFPPMMCIVAHNFHTCTPTTKVFVSLTFRFPRGVVVSETWNSEERNCFQLFMLTKVVKWLSSSYMSSLFHVSSFPAFFQKTLDRLFLSFNFFPLYQIRSYILCLCPFESYISILSLYC